jgi:hypothetical protein
MKTSFIMTYKKRGSIMQHKFIRYIKRKQLLAIVLTSLLTLLMCSAWISKGGENKQIRLNPIHDARWANPISDKSPSIENRIDQRDPEDEPSIPPFEGTVIDDLSTQFSRQGPEKYWHEEDQGFESHSWWTYNNRTGIDNAARWTIEINQAGIYEIFVYIPTSHATTKNAVYSISHSGEQNRVTVNQNLNRGVWYKLGDFNFAETGDAYIELIDETGEADTKYEIGFDAIGYRPVESDWEEKITGALWDRFRPWLDEKTALLEESLKQWLNEQKGKLLQKLADTLKNWIDQQCAGLGAAMLFPLIAFVLWHRQRDKPESN